MSTEVVRAGGVIGALGLSLLIIGPSRIWRLPGLAAWVVGCGILAVWLAPSGHHRVYAAAVVVGGLAAIALAALILRWPWLLAVAVLACAPARIPVSIGSTEAKLLVPMYLVAGAAALALAWRLFWEDGRARELGPLAWPAGLLVGWLGITFLWADDLREGAIELLFFILPFGLLAVALARTAWRRQDVLLLLVQLLGMALVFAAIGLYQWFTRDVFWNPGVEVSNAYAPFFRVNSVFYDPSVYGRFLVVAILAAVAVAIYDRRPKVIAGLVVVVAGIWAGLLVSFSQSSFAALIAGVLIATALVWRWKALLLALVTAAAVLAVSFATPSVRHTLWSKTTSSWDRATGGRASFVRNGVHIAVDHPVGGVGIGGFRRAYADRVGLKGKEPKRSASHTAAVTIAAEAGLPGLVLLVWLVAVAIFAAARRAGATYVGRTAAWTAAALGAIALHSCFYSALLEDAIFWGLLAACALCVRGPAVERAPPPRTASRPPVVLPP
jgi:O-antigen ligase